MSGLPGRTVREPRPDGGQRPDSWPEHVHFLMCVKTLYTSGESSIRH
jgi:hypothetical protein